MVAQWIGNILSLTKDNTVRDFSLQRRKQVRPMLQWLQELWTWQRERGKLWIGEHPSNIQLWKETAIRRMLNDSWSSNQSGIQMVYYHTIVLLNNERQDYRVQTWQKAVLKHATQQMLIDAKERFSCLVASKQFCGMYYTTTTSLRSHMMQKHPHEPRRTRTVTDTVVAQKSGNLESDCLEKRDDVEFPEVFESVPKKRRIGPSLGETMRTR